ncbi:alpha-L-rhamnosidase-related protein [Phycisphaera mikurensis]|nr:family 78 glycoside hydrolase catalytic domain [Phycisphaera mikurensis]
MPPHSADEPATPPAWAFYGSLAADGPPPPGSHTAVRVSFELAGAAEGGEASLALWAGGAFTANLDGEHLADGPHRCDPDAFDGAVAADPARLRGLAAGPHVLTLRVQHAGVPTRLAAEEPAAFFVRLAGLALAGAPRVRLLRLPGYAAELRRLNPQLGWIDWADARENPRGWERSGFDDDGWDTPTPMAADAPRPVPAGLGSIPRGRVEPVLLAEGFAADRFGYAADDPPARFHLRDLDPAPADRGGRWWRFDLGRVRLFFPRVRPAGGADAAGVEVQLAYSETLPGGRVLPWIPYSLGLSCNLDRFVLDGSGEAVGPLAPRGGRYVEVHALGPAGALEGLTLRIDERGFFGEPAGSFACDRPALGRVWSAGVETLHACAEDALTDNPTRERGAWVGDLALSNKVAAVAHHDLRLVRRGLVQAAAGADASGLVAGLGPGPQLHVPSFALHWLRAAWLFFDQTGDRALLRELAPAARATLAAFEPVGGAGLRRAEGWPFFDWAAPIDEEANRLALNVLLLQATRDAAAWHLALADRGHARRLAAEAGALSAAVRGEAARRGGWAATGYHAVGLALAAGEVDPAEADACLDAVESAWRSAFPWSAEADAPRLGDPGEPVAGAVTPFFADLVLPELIRRGRTAFVHEAVERCWGWMLGGGRTTLTEVFSDRWSHAHVWSAGPVAWLSRTVLGLTPRHALTGPDGVGAWSWSLQPGALRQAAGRLPLAGHPGEAIDVAWTRQDDRIEGELTLPRPLWIHRPATVTLGGGLAAEGRTRLPAGATRFVQRLVDRC